MLLTLRPFNASANWFGSIEPKGWRGRLNEIRHGPFRKRIRPARRAGGTDRGFHPDPRRSHPSLRSSLRELVALGPRRFVSLSLPGGGSVSPFRSALRK